MAAPVVHFEIGFKDIEKGKAFYGPLFGWQFDSYGPAAMLSNIGHPGKGGEPAMGIGGHLNALGHEPHNYCVVYALVEDLEGTIEKAEGLGGQCVVPPQEVPGMGQFSWLKDPEGNLFGLWKAAKQ